MIVERDAVRRMTSLRGRDDELSRVSRVLEEVKETGQGAIVVFFGEPGIGKTTMLDRAIDDARAAGFVAGIGKAQERVQIIPMASVLEAVLSGPAPLLPRTDASDLASLYGHQAWLVDRLTSILEESATRSPIAIGIDDLQWADQLSLFTLRIIPKRLSALPIAWILTSRSHPRDAAADLIATVSRDVRVEAFELEPLADRDLEQLASDRLGAPPTGRLRTLLAGTGGNPFLAVELLDAFARSGAQHVGELPPTFIDRMSQRLRSLPAESLRLVQFSSVLGHDFRIEDVAELMDTSAEALALSSLEPAVRAGILDDDGERLAFRHDLLRHAIYEDIPPTIRKALHRRAAQRMLSTGRSVLDAAPHVLVYAAAADGECEVILRQAAGLLAASMPEAAANLICRSFALLPPSDPARTETGKEAIELLARLRRGSDALRIAGELLAGRPSNEDTAQIHVLASVPLWDSGRLEDLEASVARALSLDDVSPQTRARLMALRCLALSRSEDLEDVLRAGELALSEGLRLEDVRAQTIALHALGEASRNTGRHNAALAYFQRLRSLAGNERLTDEVLTLQLLDRYDESAKLLAEGHRWIKDKGATTGFVLSVVFGQMWQNYSLGLLDEGQADAETLLRFSEEFEDDSYRLEARLILSRIAQLRSDAEVAREHFAVVARADRADAVRALMLLLVEAWLKESEGDLQGAADAVQQVVRPARAICHRWRHQAAWLIAAARIALKSGRTTLSQEVATIAQRLAERNPDVATTVAAALHAQGLLAGDAVHMKAALETARKSPRLLVRADVEAGYGALLLAESAQGPGVAALDNARNLYHSAGAIGETRRVERVLRSFGVRRRAFSTSGKRPSEGWEALTEIEKRVARLIADGYTNRGVAAELVLSPNTIGTHVRSIFGKLRVNSRVQMTRAVLERPSS